ncbi:hypothetical protein AMTRI_Chr04g180690 [Amborella trichopoda]|uniref:NADP-dependent oxidoreductase domain-containing protein n=1 Tax=Amborella trichopoda TaxID=13333 RepID=W1PV79_AMBTC|nr:non-functional NADPH-dependent codeinone reductase 2 [Amborella trichopoda]ERN11175.1 hypothetical protein AMTR_s00024p00199370 [Amborella trichopoda]|eukprot:XP_006849594.1 non-functional NADPH-dependent codeinone reductase 2 [Amborella trichopoda]
MGEVPQVVLNSGHKMPLVAMGTAQFPFVEDESLKLPILEAMVLGYRHFDTAKLYKSERALGEAIAEALNTNIIRSRGDIFITSKLWCTDVHPDKVLPALKETLERLKLEYLDLYLIHFPVRLREGYRGFSWAAEDILPVDIKGTWGAMEECCRMGLTKSIGVSNFSSKKLGDLLAYATIPPAVNQVEMHPQWQQRKMREFCEAKGIHVTAYSPLGGQRDIAGPVAVLDCEVLHEIARAKGKTAAQVSLRWVFQQGVGLVVKSFNKDRLKENLEILDWELNEEDLLNFKELPQKKVFPTQYFVSPNGPYKTVEELWDEDI